jgi:hypothetical protein
MGFVCHVASVRIPSRGWGLAVGIPAGIASFWMAATLLRVAELKEATRLVVRKIGLLS